MMTLLSVFILLIGSVECFHCPRRHILKSLPPHLHILKSSSLRSSVNDNYGDHYYGGEQRGSSYMSNHAKRDLMERRQVKRFHQMASMDRPQGRDFPPQSYPSRPYPSPEGMRRPPEPPMQQQQQQMDSFNQDVSASLKAMTEILKEVKNSQKVQSLDVELLSKRCDDMANRLSRTESKNRQMMEETKSSNPFGESLDGNFNDNVKDFVVDKSTEDYVDEIDDLKAEINRLVDTMRLAEDKLELKMESVYQRLNNENPSMDVDPSMPFGDDVQRQFQPQPPPMPAPLEAVPPEAMPPKDPFYDQNSYYSDRNAPYTGDMASDRKFASLSLTRSANDKKSGYRYEQQPQNQSFISSLSKSELTDRRMSGFGVKPPRLQNQQPPPGEMFPRQQFPPQYYEESFMYEEPYFYEEEPFMGEFFDEGEPYYY